MVSRSITQRVNHQLHLNLAPRTIRRRLVEMGLPSRIAKMKPMISAANKQKWLEWARRHVSWTPQQWLNVIFSDEVPVSLIQTSQHRYVRFYSSKVNAPEMTRSLIHSDGGRMMFWGSFRGGTVGPFVEIHDCLNAVGYREMLHNNLNVGDMFANR